MTKEQLAVAEDLKEKIVTLVRAIEDNFALGVKFKIVSQKFNKRAKANGLSLLSLVEELNASGELFKYMNADGAILLMAPEVKHRIKLDEDFGILTQESKEFIGSRWGKHAAKD